MTNAKKVNHIALLLSTASLINTNNEALEAGKSAKNAFSWQCFFILKEGFIQDKQALERMTRKGGELFKFRSYVSKAKTVLHSLESGDTIEVNEQEPVSIETIKAYSFTALPEVTLSTLYSTIKKAEKEQDIEATINEHAALILEDKYGQPVSELQATMPERFNEVFAEAQAQARAAIEAEAAKESTMDKIKTLINTLSSEEVNALALYVMDKVDGDTKEAVAA